VGGFGVGIWNSGGGSGPTINFADEETPAGVINGSNATFTLAHTPSPAIVYLVKNRLNMIPTTDYTLAGNTITYTAGSKPQTGDIHFASYRY
jgi:hypothetical protein